MTPSDIARAICCPSGTCIRPERCFATTPGEQTLVDVKVAASAVHKLLCERWREWPKHQGPLSRTTVYGGDEG